MSIVLMSDPRVAAIPVADNGAPLADVRAGGEPLRTRLPAPLRTLLNHPTNREPHTA